VHLWEWCKVQEVLWEIISHYETEALMTEGDFNKKDATDVDTILEDSLSELTISIRKHCETCLQARRAQLANNVVFELPHIMEVIKTHIEVAGSQRLFGEQLEITSSYVSNVLKGVREPSKKMLEAIGYEAVTVYRKIVV
jgi:hypothetical protein